MATYTGSDKRLGYLFQNGGGGGGSSTLAGLSDVSLSSPADGQVLKYDANAQEWVNANESGGGGVVDDGTVGFYKNEGWQDPLNKTYSFDDLGITEQGVYLLSITSQHANSSTGVSYFGVLFYGARYISSYAASYVYKIKGNNAEVYLDEANETLRFYGTWGENYAIEVLPLHPKIEVEKHTYSATEQVVGTWVDGKPLYELTTLLPITYSPQTGGAQNAGNQVIPVANVELITDLKILPLSPSTASHIQTCRTSAFQVSVTDIFAYSDKIQLNQMTFAANLTWVGVNGVYIIVQYTKTTD